MRGSSLPCTVRRRTFLASAAAVASTVVTAGCAQPVENDAKEKTKTPPKIERKITTSGLVPSLPVSEVKAITASAIESAPTSIADPGAIETALHEVGLDGAKLSEYDTFLSLTHSNAAGEDGGIARTLGTVAGTYAGYIHAAGDERPLSVTVKADGKSVGEYAVAAKWAAEYSAGTTSAKEYGEKVLSTTKTTG